MRVNSSNFHTQPKQRFGVLYFVVLGCVAVLCYITVWDRDKLEKEREMDHLGSLDDDDYR